MFQIRLGNVLYVVSFFKSHFSLKRAVKARMKFPTGVQSQGSVIGFPVCGPQHEF